MADTKTLLQLLLDLLHDPEAVAAFRENPQEFLNHAGLSNVSVDDIKELLPVVLEKVNPSHCASYESSCDTDNCYDSHCDPAPCHTESHCDPHDGEHCYDPSSSSHHDSEFDRVVQHLNYVTNNYSYVDASHDTYNNYETNYETNNVSNIWAGEGSDVDVTNQTANLANGSTLVLGDNNAPITPGDGNVVGDGNQVAGQHSTASFGEGSALSGVGTGDGGAISIGGDATGSHADPTLINHDGTASIGGAATDDHGTTITDSGNEAHVTDNSDNSTHTTDIADSGNDNSQQTDASTNDSGNTDFHL